MNIQEFSGCHNSSGELTMIDAAGEAVIKHTGNSRLVWTRDNAKVTVRGRVSGAIRATDESRVLAWGSNLVSLSASKRASIAMYGNPGEVVADDRAEITIFGEPKTLRAETKGIIRVISLYEDYAPESEWASPEGRIAVFTPALHRGHFPKGGLGFELEDLFGQPLPPNSDTEYLAYIALVNELSEPQAI